MNIRIPTRSILLAAVVSVSAIFTGCQHGGAYAPKNTTKYNLEDDIPVVLMDKMVQRSVTSPGVEQSTLPDGRLRIVAKLRNRESRRIQVQVSCVFKNANGFSTGDETPWVDVILTEGSQEGVVFDSMNDQAKKFTVRVRQAH